ncbi:ComF family protein [Elizabethkingia argentiflava]|uniref:ComF family protein n=1 Tax=Elizabethkingia argenteiflava TaxID=2681556 RepID=A0A845PTW2_9FLAO|nr:double zinc ribbon domain-containing protein [Elizabethkingia argenteiflava]NAW50503.1 ComF family protein [Elizabethkingia argenteiflava]
MNFVTDLLFPNRCLNCNHIIYNQDIICEQCYDQINFTHWEALKQNPLKLKLNTLFPVRETYALMHFEKQGLCRKIIHHLKYKHRENIGRQLAKWTVKKIKLHIKPDLLINIPLHPRKMKKRGYNQLHLYTETLSHAWGIPFDHHYLKRITHHKPQAGKNRLSRQHNTEIFTVPLARCNTHFLLIDDICTTGNTMAGCAWKILEASNNSISILVMAID